VEDSKANATYVARKATKKQIAGIKNPTLQRDHLDGRNPMVMRKQTQV